MCVCVCVCAFSVPLQRGGMWDLESRNWGGEAGDGRPRRGGTSGREVHSEAHLGALPWDEHTCMCVCGGEGARGAQVRG